MMPHANNLLPLAVRPQALYQAGWNAWWPCRSRDDPVEDTNSGRRRQEGRRVRM